MANELEFGETNQTEEIKIVREKSEEEIQVHGMKELFTSMVMENKKEYDRQLEDMKKLFFGVLEESRNSFKEQITLLSSSLSNQRTIAQPSKDEEFIFLSEIEEKQASTNPQIEKYRKLDAVSAIILGQEVDILTQRIHSASMLAEQNFQAGIQNMASILSELNTELEMASARISQNLETYMNELAEELNATHKRTTMREEFAALISELADKTRSV